MSVSSESVRVLAPAKINLFLSVEGKYLSGYHEICTIMCLVSLCDLLFFSFQKKGLISVVCGDGCVSKCGYNLVDKAIHLFFKELDEDVLCEKPGINVYIEKKIPVGAGFGGGSSDAASTLLLLNARFGHPFSKSSLMSMGSKIGTDVPFFMFGKPAIVRGIGDLFSGFSHELPKFALLVYTGVVLSTRWVYENLDLSHNLRLTKGEKELSKFNPDVDEFDCKSHMINDLESVSVVEFPVIAEVKRILLELGAVGTLMSGSGSGVFGLFMDVESVNVARSNLLRRVRGKGWVAYSVRLLSN